MSAGPCVPHGSPPHGQSALVVTTLGAPRNAEPVGRGQPGHRPSQERGRGQHGRARSSGTYAWSAGNGRLSRARLDYRATRSPCVRQLGSARRHGR